MEQTKRKRRQLRPPKEATLGFRIEADLKRAVEDAATTMNRSVGEWAAMAFRRALRGEGVRDDKA